MRHGALAPAFLASLLVHVTGLLSVSLLWGSLHVHTVGSDLIPAEMVIAPPPAPEPMPVPEAEPLTPPAKVEPITPPKAVEKVLPKRAESRPKRLPAAKPPPPMASHPPGPPPTPETKTFEKPKPSPLTPMPDEEPAPAGANTLGPSATNTPTDQPAKSIEGGESGAGELSDRGDLPVVPGTGVSGGSGGPGRVGLGWGSEGRGARLGGLRPGSGDEGPGGGGGSFARPLGGYQLLPRYPESARRQGVTGTTTLLFEVLANGRVGEVQIERSAGHPDLDQAAAEAIKKWRFDPARRGNQPVAVWLRMPVRFVLR